MDVIRVLLIEDDPGDARLIQEYLNKSRNNRFVLTHVDRLSSGLESLGRGETDIVVLDLGLPDSQGTEAFDKLHSRFPSLPILILTGLDDEFTETQTVRNGAQDYLVKGEISANLLARSIRYAIERTG